MLRGQLSYISGAPLALALLGFVGLATTPVLAQKADPDVLTFTNGDKLTGHLVRSTGKSVVFGSDMAGEITVDWSKIKELHAGGKFAVIENGIKLAKKPDTSKIPLGSIAMTDQRIEVGTTPPQTIPVGDAAYVVDQDAFQKAVRRTPFFENWKGAVSAGATLVQATQDSRAFNVAINLLRNSPDADWLDPRNRTTADFSMAYGTVSQPNTPTLKTSIYHAGGERDEYFSPRLYAFGRVAYDHNFSQGLDLEQTYGGGVGLTVVRTAAQTFDLKGSFNYVRQQFAGSASNQNLVGATVSENYRRTLIHGIQFTEQLAITPAFNNSSAYTATGSAGLVFPVYKRFGFNLNTIDTLLNDPPPGFKKNSFQLAVGLTYTLP